MKTVVDINQWYRAISYQDRFDRFGYLPWWEVLRTEELIHAFRTQLAEGETPPGFMMEADRGIEQLAWALDQHKRRLDLWYCIYTDEGWRLVFSHNTDAMTARLLL